MQPSLFEFVCAGCLASRGLLETEQLPPACPDCGARDPWVGPFVVLDPQEADSSDPENVLYSPFYMAAVRPGYGPALH